MWLNFKSDERNAGGGQSGRFPRPPSGLSRGISRQSSTRSSTRSVKSGKSSTTNLLRKLEEHEFKTKSTEWQKNQDYKMIRERRKTIRKQIDAKLRVVRRLYIPSILGIIFGIIFLFGATIRTLSDGTVFWSFREQFRIIGPVLIVLGVILLLTTVGLESHSMGKLKEAGIHEVKPVIHPDFLLEPMRFDRQRSNDSCGSSCYADCIQVEKHKLLSKHSNPDEPDQVQKGKINLTAQWAKAMSLNLSESPVRVKEDTRNANVADETADDRRRDGTNIRAINNVPNIEITNVDEISRQPVSSAPSSDSMSKTSSAASLQKSDKEFISSSKMDTVLNKNGSVLSREVNQLRDITEETVSQTKDYYV